MCGRFQLKLIEDWTDEFGVEEPPDMAPRYNIAPTQDVVVVHADRAGGRRAARLRWGLVLSGSAAAGPPLINARAETVSTRGVFRDAFRRRRCLVPAHGFYEWRPLGRTRQPYLIHRRDSSAFAFAGLWEPGSEEGRGSCTIVTTEANGLVAPIHDRMPVLLARSAYGPWLDPAAPAADLLSLLVPSPSEELEAYPISTRVNAAEVDDLECEQPLRDFPPVPVQASLFDDGE